MGKINGNNLGKERAYYTVFSRENNIYYRL